MSASLKPAVLYSQNFLQDAHLVASLLDKSKLTSEDVVYEIGPGRGIITEQLARRFKRVVAIEKDPRLSTFLRQKFAHCPNVTIHAGDFLDYPLPRKPYKVFANIPFNITASIVTRLTTAEYPPEDAYLVMQKEAAEMFLGKPRESLRSLLLKPWFSMEIIHHFQRADFHPAPRVDVVLLRVNKRGPPLLCRADRQCFRDFVVYLFTTWNPVASTPLKSLFTRPQCKYIQRALGLGSDIIPISITCEQWLSLFAYFKMVGSERAFQMIVGSEQGLIQQQNKLRKIHRTRSGY